MGRRQPKHRDHEFHKAETPGRGSPMEKSFWEILATEQRRDRREEYEVARGMLPKFDADGQPKPTEKPAPSKLDPDVALASQQGFARGPKFFFPFASDWILRCLTDEEHLDQPKPLSYCDGEWHHEQRKSRITKKLEWWAYRECPHVTALAQRLGRAA